MVSGANSQTTCLHSLSAIVAAALLYVVIFSSPQDRSHFRVVQALPGLLAVCVLAGTALEGGLLSGADPSECRMWCKLCW